MVFNLPNRVVERQRAYQASTAPVWLRPPRSKTYIYPYYALWYVGLGATTYGIFSLIKGKPAEGS
ncbi:hypothetical protein FRC03_002845 [Tulasnella sp. 419]|nr:hypothetical protein FRC03_002845 [Tulasnella sp. 419]